MRKDTRQDLLTIALLAGAALALCLGTWWLQESGYRCAAERLFLLGWLVGSWGILIAGIRQGNLAPFRKTERPNWFRVSKYTGLVTLSLFTLLLLYLLIRDCFLC